MHAAVRRSHSDMIRAHGDKQTHEHRPVENEHIEHDKQSKLPVDIFSSIFRNVDDGNGLGPCFPACLVASACVSNV